MRGLRTILLLGFAAISLDPARTYAQTLTINGGASATLKAGTDFATEVIGDPWDFEQASDYSYMFSDDGTGASAFQTVPSLTDGVLRGVSRNGTVNLKLLFEGVGGAFNAVTKTGVRYPIDANRFKRVSFRLRRGAVVNATPESDLMNVQWVRQMSLQGGGVRYAGAHGAFGGDRFANQSPVADQGKTTYHIYTLDPDSGPVREGDWSGIMGGISLLLANNSALAGQAIELDWVRLTPRGEAVATLAWSGFSGAVTLTAQNAATGDTIQIYPASGTTFPASGTFQWDYGFLPGGAWAVTASSGGQSRAATLTIDPAPLLTITEPDASGGRDWATTVWADSWDLTNPQDVTRHGRLYQVTNASFSESGVNGTTTGTDPFVQVLGETAGPKIPTTTYHRLTFTLQHDHPELMARDVADRAAFEGGHVARVIWNRNNVFQETQDIFVVDGIAHTYTMDLSTLTNTSTEIEAPTRVLWTSGDMDLLRIDINESSVPRGFRLSNIKLAADDAPNGNGFFLIKWSASDATFSRQIAGGAGGDATVAIYYDTDRDPANKTLIASNVNAAVGQYAWDVSGLQVGVPYYVYIQITDASGNTQGRYSGGPVTLTTAFPAGLRTDNDSNGLPDQWEQTYLVASAAEDTDGDGLTNLQEYQAGTNPRLSNVWNLSEGATGFFSQRIALANPSAAEAAVSVKYLRGGSKPPVLREYTVLPYGRLTINVNDLAGFVQEDVSAVITSLSGGVVAERTMAWGDLWWGGHTGKAIQHARTEWFLAEGASNALFSTFILLANATSAPANVTLTFLRQGQSAYSITVPVPAESRYTFDAQAIPELAGALFSTRVTSDQPISVERSMYLKSSNRPFEGGHESAAVAEPRTDWFLAEGATGGLFQMYVLLANPNAQANQVTLRYLMPGRTPVTTTISLPPNSRTTLEVGDQNQTPGVSGTEVSVEVRGQLPLVVERAMYWPRGGPWTDGHNSVGINELGTTWAMAEGELGGSRGYLSYILFANPSASSALVRLTFLREGGRPPVTEEFVVNANERLTRSAAEFVGAGKLSLGEKFGILVTSVNDVPIAVERAMYWNGGGEFFGAGTNEVGFRLR